MLFVVLIIINIILLSACLGWNDLRKRLKWFYIDHFRWYSNVLNEHEKISKQKKDELLKPLEIPLDIKNWIEAGLKLDSLNQLKQQLYLYEYLVK